MSDFFHDTNNWVALSFLIFAFAAWKLGYRNALGVLDSRIKDIRKDIENAESLRIEAQEMLAQYQRKQRDAIKDAEEITANARVHADKIRRQAEAEIEQAMTRREDLLAARLRTMEETAIATLRAQAADLAIETVRRVLAEHLNAAHNDTLVRETTRALPTHIH